MVTADIVIIGGGIAGLAAAHRLVVDSRNTGMKVDVLVCEARGCLGGTIHTYQLDDIIMELGPDSFITEKPAAVELCKELGIVVPARILQRSGSGKPRPTLVRCLRAR